MIATKKMVQANYRFFYDYQYFISRTLRQIGMHVQFYGKRGRNVKKTNY